MEENFHCGYIALVGRPNVGKSTLLNRILGQKISITSQRPADYPPPHLGIKTLAHAQLIYVDTPGIHDYSGRAMNRHMNRTATPGLRDVDVVVFVVEGLRWTARRRPGSGRTCGSRPPGDPRSQQGGCAGQSRNLCCRGCEALSDRHVFAEIIPMSAAKAVMWRRWRSAIEELLPRAPPFFPEDQVTDRLSAFWWPNASAKNCFAS